MNRGICFSIATLSAGLLGLPASPAAADSIRLETPMAAASLHDGGVDMVVYYLERGGDLHVVATYAAQRAPDAPARLRLDLTEGGHMSFQLPGVMYSFARAGTSIAVEATPTDANGHVAVARTAQIGTEGCL